MYQVSNSPGDVSLDASVGVRSSTVPPAAVMPSTVKVAVGAVGLLVLVNGIGGAIDAAQGEGSWALVLAAMALLLMVRLIQRSRLAWQWGRRMSLFTLAILGVGAYVASGEMSVASTSTLWALGNMGALVVVLAFLFGSLSMRSAKRFFALECPRCERTGTAADFLFREARCTRCKQTF